MTEEVGKVKGPDVYDKQCIKRTLAEHSLSCRDRLPISMSVEQIRKQITTEGGAVGY